MKQIKTLLFSVLIAFSAQACTSDDTIRVLCIGNSFSWDAVEQELAPLCEAEGQAIVIGNLYYGGCSLEQHHTFLMKDTGAYSFRYIEQVTLTPNMCNTLPLPPITHRPPPNLCPYEFLIKYLA